MAQKPASEAAQSVGAAVGAAELGATVGCSVVGLGVVGARDGVEVDGVEVGACVTLQQVSRQLCALSPRQSSAVKWEQRRLLPLSARWSAEHGVGDVVGAVGAADGEADGEADGAAQFGQ